MSKRVLITSTLSSDLFSFCDLSIILSSTTLKSTLKSKIKSRIKLFLSKKDNKKSDCATVLGYPSKINPSLHSVLYIFLIIILFNKSSETK